MKQPSLLQEQTQPPIIGNHGTIKDVIMRIEKCIAIPDSLRRYFLHSETADHNKRIGSLQRLVQSRYLLPLQEGFPLSGHLIPRRPISSAVGADELDDCRFVARLDDATWIRCAQ